MRCLDYHSGRGNRTIRQSALIKVLFAVVTLVLVILEAALVLGLLVFAAVGFAFVPVAFVAAVALLTIELFFAAVLGLAFAASLWVNM